MKKLFFIFFSVLFISKANAQSLAINTDGSTANASSILDVKSIAKGVLIPRMKKSERDFISTPATGLLVYVNAPDTVGFSYYNGTSWLWIASGNYATDTTAWKLTGNSNATSQSFLGTTNDTALRFKIRNIQSGIIDSTTQNTALGYEALKTSNNAGAANTAFGFGAGKSQTTGTSNVMIGRNALSSTSASSQNVAIGDSAMGNAVRSFGNTAVGYQSLKNLEGLNLFTYNTAIGYASQTAATGNTNPTLSNLNTSVGGYSMSNNVAGQQNVAIGISALRFNDSSSNNTAIGMNALAYHKRNGASNNVAIGTYALERDTIGVWNTALGAEAMRFATRSTLNSVVGFRTLKLIKDGGENNTLGVGTMEYKDTALGCVAIGRFALSGHASNNNMPDTGSIAIGTRAGRYNNVSFNTFIGYESGIGSNGVAGMTGKEIVSIGSYSLNNLSTGNSNSTFGYAALFNNTTGNGNIGVGTRSLYNNLNGNYNIAIGDSAMYGNGINSGNKNIAIGSFALRNTVNTSNNIAIGDSSMYGSVSFNGNDNVALGNGTLRNITTGSSNVAIGGLAGYNLTDGYTNSFVGFHAGYSVKHSDQSVAVGAFALSSDTSGTSNVAIGYSALAAQTNRLSNVAIGIFALQNNGIPLGYRDYLADEGNLNIAIGPSAMNTNKMGSKNIAIGTSALNGDTASTNSVAIGHNAGLVSNTAPRTGNIFLGYQSGQNEITSNKLYIENSNANKDNALIYGDFAADSLNLNAKVNIRDFTRLGTQVSGAPAIKMKTISGTSPTVDNFLSYPTGIADAKVLSFAVLVEYSGGWKIPPSYRDAAGYEYNVQFQSGNVVIINKTGNSASIGAKPFRVLITYEE